MEAAGSTKTPANSCHIHGVTFLNATLHGTEMSSHFTVLIKVKVKFTLEKATKAQRWSRRIGCSFFNLGDRQGSVINAKPRPLFLRQRPSTHCIGGWVGPRVDLGKCGKSRSHQNSIPGLSSP
jgi:hypothetical protein